MTNIIFCPNCGAVIAYDSEDTDKQTQCRYCGHLFVISSLDSRISQKAAPHLQETERPPAGFYRGLFIDSWKIFTKPQNAVGLIFLAAAACFRFFTGHIDYSFNAGNVRLQMPFGFVISIFAWGCLFWYYMEIIHSTAFGDDDLPEPCIGGFFGFIWNTLKSFFLFFIIMIIAAVPCLIGIIILRKINTDSALLLNILAFLGAFIMPVLLLNISTGRDIEFALRPDYIFKPVIKAPLPYLLVAVIFGLTLTLFLKNQLTGYDDLAGRSFFVIALNLAAAISIQALAVITMRAIGLFYRHHSYCFP